MSENALAAAMRPKSYGSSTIGVKKSTVATIARSAERRNTAASSRVAASTRIRGSIAAGTWRKTCANSAGPSLQAQPAPCENAVSRTVVMGCGNIMDGRWTRSLPLAKPPSEEAASRDVAGHVEPGVDDQGSPSRWLDGAPQHEPTGESDKEPDEEEEQPPAASAQRIEPQRGEQHDDRGLDQAPRDFPAAVGPDEIGRSGRGVPALTDRRRDHEQGGDRQPREQQPAEGHLPRRSGGRNPGPRSPRPGRAAVNVPWSSTTCPLTST